MRTSSSRSEGNEQLLYGLSYYLTSLETEPNRTHLDSVTSITGAWNDTHLPQNITFDFEMAFGLGVKK